MPGPFSRSSFSTYEPPKSTSQQTDPRNPDPHNYKIMESVSVNNFLIVKIKYPNCTNYEGKKILVYRNCTLHDLTTQSGGIDPHFCNKGYPISPIARFEPTEEGYRMALSFARNYKG